MQVKGYNFQYLHFLFVHNSQQTIFIGGEAVCLGNEELRFIHYN